MANKLKIKRSAVPGKVPTVADLDLGELAINTYDGKVYMKKNVSGVETIVLMTGAGAGDVLGPASSGDKAIARFSGTGGKTIQNSSASIDDSGNISATSHRSSGTDYDKMVVGTTAQRPASPTAGMYRMNSTTGEPEWYDASSSNWVPFANSKPYTIEALLVAGGGGGGSEFGGGGGAGGMITYSGYAVTGTGYSIVVGGGGAAGTGQGGRGTVGGNSTAFGQTAIGGGAGAQPYGIGGAGGSGGGGGRGGAGGSGTTGQGNAGGQSADTSGGGGGGKAAAGGASATNWGGGGGAGAVWPSGGSTYYAGGGGGAGYLGVGGSGGAGGTGGGGQGGGASTGGPGYGGADQRGGGGGGGSYSSGSFYNGGPGGNGIVVIRYAGAQKGTGGAVTSDGTYTYHTFTSSGTFTA